jgi:hypothetical protein
MVVDHLQTAFYTAWSWTFLMQAVKRLRGTRAAYDQMQEFWHCSASRSATAPRDAPASAERAVAAAIRRNIRLQ